MKIRTSLPIVFTVPTMAVLAILAFVPTIDAINIALQNRELSNPDSVYVGFANFRALIDDPRFLNSVRVSIEWEILTVVATMAVAIPLAVLLFEATSPNVRNALCVLFIVPALLPRVSAAFVWRFAFHPLFGLAVYPLRLITGHPVDLLADPHTAMLAVAVVDVWQWGLLFSVVIVKLLETLPPQPIEAARLDHARTWEVYAYVALPMLRGADSLVFVKMIESLRAFDLIYVMTRGDPGITTETLDMYAFSQGFIESRPYLLCVEHGAADDDRDDCGLHCSLATGAAVARGLSRFAARAIIALVVASVGVPILWTLLSGFKNRVDIVTPTPMLFFTPTLDNFLYVLERESVHAGLINSIIVSGCSVLRLGFLWPTPLRDIRCASPTTSSFSYCRWDFFRWSRLPFRSSSSGLTSVSTIRASRSSSPIATSRALPSCRGSSSPLAARTSASSVPSWPRTGSPDRLLSRPPICRQVRFSRSRTWSRCSAIRSRGSSDARIRLKSRTCPSSLPRCAASCCGIAGSTISRGTLGCARLSPKSQRRKCVPYSFS
jgi:multiple sugar transport system permease protein